MNVAPMRVVGPDEQVIRVEPGDVWPLPYRGSKYTVLRLKDRETVVWARQEQRIEACEVPTELVTLVRRVKEGSYGSFRLTAHGAVVTKVPERWEPRYVGIYENGLRFEGIDNDPQSLTTGMYWTGFPFYNGETWVVSPYTRSQNQLQWKMRGRRFVSTERYPEILSACLDIRPTGGRIYLTESGHVWMNVPDGGVSPRYRDQFQALQRRQVDQLQSNGNGVLLRLLVMRINATKTRPIYVGRICDFDHGAPPWTRYSAGRDHQFGRAPGDVADDQLRGV